MSSDDDKEAFEVTDHDLLEELQPKRRYQSKSKATYGIWAEDSDDESALRPGFGKNVPDYAAAMNFVSGGIKGAEKSSKNEDEEKNEDLAGTSSESEEEVLSMKTATGTKFAFSTGAAADKSFGNWEKYTKGIGAKLLQKMGHVSGKGLGKNAQGIINPIESGRQRKGRGTIGMYGSEHTVKTKMRMQEVDSEEEEDKEFQQKLNQWKKTDDVKSKPKYLYKTADEILASGSSRKLAPETGLSNVKVVDMTGREKRVMTGYRAISKHHDKPKEEAADLYVELKAAKRVFDMPELVHNLDLLVEMAEDDIIQNDKKLKYAKDVIVNLRYEEEKMSKVCERERQQTDRLQTLVSTVEAMNARINGLSPEPLEFEECASTFKYLKLTFPEEFLIYDISYIALTMVKPLMKNYFNQWRPLKDKSFGLDVISVWKEILHDESGRYGYNEQITDPYDTLMWDVWMPQVRGVISNINIRDCDDLIELLERWIPLLSPWISGNLLVQLILPKLHQEVERWDPLTDTVPIHAWIHPWLPLMSSRLDPVYEPIRLKLGNALRNWHPSDPSARLILQPWVAVFHRGHLDAFLIKHILPKLHLCMSEFIINPHQQHLDAWNWVMSWKEIIPHHTMVALLDKTFFPKWHQVLTTWLNTNPNYEEIAKWFAGWKNMMPDDLAQNPIIKEHFSSALNVMNRAVSGKKVPITLVRDVSPVRQSPPPPPPPPSAPPSGVPQSFRELVERKAEENCLLFVPVPNKLREGKQVYKLGAANIYLDRNVIFVNDKPNSWIPVSLNTVLEYAQ